jgi:hypothetical protein
MIPQQRLGAGIPRHDSVRKDFWKTIYVSGECRYFFDSHAGGSWGAARGYRIVEVYPKEENEPLINTDAKRIRKNSSFT